MLENAAENTVTDNRMNQKTLDTLTPLSFVWPLLVLLPLLRYRSQIMAGDWSEYSLFCVTFFVWLPFFWLYLVFYVIFTKCNLPVLKTVGISALLSLSLVGVAWMLFFR